MATLNSPEITNCPQIGSRLENLAVIDLGGDICLTTAWKDRRVNEMEDLYGRPPGHTAAFYGPDELSSSTPDLRSCGDSHLDDADCFPAPQDRYRSSSDDSHHDYQCEPSKSVQKSSNITKISSNVLPQHGLRGARPHKCRGVPFPRRYSMDSPKLVEGKDQANRPASKRTIKISSPGQASTMYISAVDTLGGLPDSDELYHRRSYDIHFPASSSSGGHHPDSRRQRSRRASCPVIFEIEELCDCPSPVKLGSQEGDVGLHSSSASPSSSEEFEPDQSSSEPRLRGQFFLGSAPLKTPEEVKRTSNRQLLVTSIVDKLKANVSDNVKISSVELLVDSSTNTAATSKTRTSARASWSRTNSRSGSRPTSGRSSPSSGPVKAGREDVTMSMTRTDSSSSSLSDEANCPGSLSRKSSATSSADESNS